MVSKNLVVIAWSKPLGLGHARIHRTVEKPQLD